MFASLLTVDQGNERPRAKLRGEPAHAGLPCSRFPRSPPGGGGHTEMGADRHIRRAAPAARRVRRRVRGRAVAGFAGRLGGAELRRSRGRGAQLEPERRARQRPGSRPRQRGRAGRRQAFAARPQRHRPRTQGRQLEDGRARRRPRDGLAAPERARAGRSRGVRRQAARGHRPLPARPGGAGGHRPRQGEGLAARSRSTLPVAARPEAAAPGVEARPAGGATTPPTTPPDPRTST